MPELPEVETVRRGIARVLEGKRIVRVTVHRRDLRWPIPADFEARLTGATVTAVSRRAKYALIHIDRHDVALVHLGMSGRIRLDPESPETHDHVEFVVDDGHRLVFNDARRFGSLDITQEANLMHHPLLRRLGPEPLGNDFNGPVLEEMLKGRRSSIKAALLDQQVVAGLGNIYVCEALFLARIHPSRIAGDIKSKSVHALAQAIRDVLARAIEVGGSTLRDYVQVDGELGYFQHEWRVYGREGEACRICSGGISRIVQSNRSTFLCATCQK